MDGRNAFSIAFITPFQGGVNSQTRARYRMSDPDDVEFLFRWLEQAWVGPCMAKLPAPLHGLCLFLPAFAVAGLILGSVAILARREARLKAEAAKGKSE